MFTLAILIGIYSYLIFSLGLIGILSRNNILIATLLFIAFTIVIYKKNIFGIVKTINKLNLKKYVYPNKITYTTIILILLISLQAGINLIGALGPELSFDALWYHLTIPKIFLANHSIFYIPGNLLYYSVMPKSIDLLYVTALAFGNEITAKVIHYFFGILILISIYKFSRKYCSKTISLLSVAIFYSNFVVGWESIVSYIDLGRAFFEFMALWSFINYLETKKRIWLYESAVILGIAISTKLLSILSIIVFIIMLLFSKSNLKMNLKDTIKNALFFLFFSILIPFPWFIFSYINTGNPFYPFFTKVITYDHDFNLIFKLFDPIKFIVDIWLLFTRSPDPVSPIYLIIIPVIYLAWKKSSHIFKTICLYSLLFLIIWYLTPRIGGSRFILSSLPAFSVLCGLTIANLNVKIIKSVLVYLILLISLISVIYRGGANLKYFPYVFGKQTKQEFLKNNLNFSYGGFYDIDSFFKNNIKNTDKVLIIGMHNLYYVDFPYVHESWIMPGEEFNYILVQDGILPERFRLWRLIYENKFSRVKVYSFGGQKWAY